MTSCTRKTLFAILLALLSTTAFGAEDNPYTYVKMSLLVPWTLYFVFLAAVLIPFVVMIGLAGNGGKLMNRFEMNSFLRIGLPLVLIFVLTVVALYVFNALQATDLMELERRVGPTILNP